MNKKIYKDQAEVADVLATKLFNLFQGRKEVKTTIALSGGSTPFVMFKVLAENYGTQINWSLIHFFWVDERCVHPENDESNYKNTVKALFSRIDIPEENIHRVHGENDQHAEVNRYAAEIDKHVEKENGLPKFDIVLLGMGDDGHTASIFPHQIELMNAKANVVAAQNPYSGQNRISLSGLVINNALQIYFLVTGSNKAKVLHEIANQENGYLDYPTSHISTNREQTTWFLDQEAAALIS